MLWKGAYSEHCYCPECWASWEFFALRGFNEDDPIKCPNCGGTKTRLYSMGDVNGDQIKQAQKEMRESEKKENQEGSSGV